MADNVLRSWKLQLPPSGRIWRRVKDDANDADESVSADEGKVEDDGDDDEGGSERKEASLDEAVEEVAKLATSVDEWEILSDKSSSGGGTMIIISKTGSVRSIASLGSGSNIVSVSNKNSASITRDLSILQGAGDISLLSPFTLQRSLSNSTIASEDNCSFGASCHDIVYGIPNVDYVEHVVMPTDTLQGICLSYKVSATRLRQANQFSGSTLLLAPKKLVIPLSKNGVKTGAIRMQDKTTKAFKLQALQAEYQDMTADDAKAYLTTARWDLDSAIRAVHSDGEWEKSVHASSPSSQAQQDDSTHKSGDIRITLKVYKGVPISATIRGSGRNGATAATTTTTTAAAAAAAVGPVSFPAAPSPVTATPTDCSAEDLHTAAPVHEGNGVEMQPIKASKS